MLLAAEELGARRAERMNQIETFVPFRFPICLFAGEKTLFHPPPANRALKQPERLLAGGPQTLPPLSNPQSLQEGAEAQNHLSSSSGPLAPLSEMWWQSSDSSCVKLCGRGEQDATAVDRN